MNTTERKPMNASLPKSTRRTLESPPAWIAFDRSEKIASGAPADVAIAVRTRLDSDADALVLVFDRYNSEPIEIDLRGTEAELVARLPVSSTEVEPIEPNTPPLRSVGRPKLGVTAREVTLLPRHWDWLAKQPGGASVALRKLVEHALRTTVEVNEQRQVRESTYRFINAIAGNEVGHEEAVRALFSGDLEMFAGLMAAWPQDVREHALRLAGASRPITLARVEQ